MRYKNKNNIIELYGYGQTRGKMFENIGKAMQHPGRTMILDIDKNLLSEAKYIANEYNTLIAKFKLNNIKVSVVNKAIEIESENYGWFNTYDSDNNLQTDSTSHGEATKQQWLDYYISETN